MRAWALPQRRVVPVPIAIGPILMKPRAPSLSQLKRNRGFTNKGMEGFLNFRNELQFKVSVRVTF